MSSTGQPGVAAAMGRNFGEEGGLLTYEGHVRLADLLALQAPQSDPPAHDEMLFITVHQVYERWLRQMLHELEAVRDAMMADQTRRARHLLQRAHAPYLRKRVALRYLPTAIGAI